jgi:hypothetical protein
LLSNFDIPFFAILLAGLFFHFSDISSRLNIANPTLKAMRIALSACAWIAGEPFEKIGISHIMDRTITCPTIKFS